jgi:hypothetical protein
VRGEAVLRLLRLLAQPGSLVVLLEDLHWADPDSLATIEYLGDNVKITALSQQVDQASSSIALACVGPRGPARTTCRSSRRLLHALPVYHRNPVTTSHRRGGEPGHTLIDTQMGDHNDNRHRSARAPRVPLCGG